MAAELREFIQKEDPVMRRRHFSRHRRLLPTDQVDIQDRVVRGPEGPRRDPRCAGRVRPATRWMGVVSMASASVIAGRMVARRRANIDVPAPESCLPATWARPCLLTGSFMVRREHGLTTPALPARAYSSCLDTTVDSLYSSLDALSRPLRRDRAGGSTASRSLRSRPPV
jgi:hypothetical protein